VRDHADPAKLVLRETKVSPRKTDLVVAPVALAWAPFRTAAGRQEPAYRT
jgi:hypothetical protein